jgi:hypothetical protein
MALRCVERRTVRKHARRVLYSMDGKHAKKSNIHHRQITRINIRTLLCLKKNFKFNAIPPLT